MVARIYNIAQTLRASLPVWPADTAFRAEPVWSHGDGCPVAVAGLTLLNYNGAVYRSRPKHTVFQVFTFCPSVLALIFLPLFAIPTRRGRGASKEPPTPVLRSWAVSSAAYTSCGR